MNSKIIEQIEKLRFSTTPFFKIENDIPKIQGTCSFIEYKKHYFIITAGHVLRDFENNLFLPIEIKSKTLLKPSGQSYIDNINDIGIIALDEPAVVNVKRIYKFLEILDNSYNNEDLNFNFSFIGFPETKGRFNRYKDKINIEPLISTTIKANKEDIERIGLQFEDKICILYDKNNVYNILQEKYKTGPDLYGISGCVLVRHSENDFNIYGILTDWNQKNKNILVGTKMKYIQKVLDYAIKKT